MEPNRPTIIYEKELHDTIHVMLSNTWVESRLARTRKSKPLISSWTRTTPTTWQW